MLTFFVFFVSVCEVISGTVGAVLPSGVQKAIFNTLFSIGRAQASEMILNESNPLGSSRLSKLKKILAEGRSLQLQFPAEDLGFRYHSFPIKRRQKVLVI